MDSLVSIFDNSHILNIICVLKNRIISSPLSITLNSMSSVNILLLGEGNFSFTLGLIKRLSSMNTPSSTASTYNVLSTSYDSYDDIKQKYPDSAMHTLNMINKHCKTHNGSNMNIIINVSILHSIDATISISNQIRTTSSMIDARIFDYIIFNFPHLGVEDCMLHKSMIAHFMHSIKDTMIPNKSVLYIALSEEQAQRWMLMNIAVINHMKLCNSIPFYHTDWHPYELKRHHTGRSFQSRLKNYFHYSFIMHVSNSGVDDTAPNAYTGGTCDLLLQLSLEKIENNTINSKPTIATTSTAVVDDRTKLKLKKRKYMTVTNDHFTVEKVIDNDNRDNFCNIYTCNTCGKDFTCEASARTHIYSLHILCKGGEGGGKDKSSNSNCDTSTTSTYCHDCDRRFNNSDAYNQHRLSKHGQYDILKPDWSIAAKSSLSTDVVKGIVDGEVKDDKAYKCHVCEALFDNEDTLLYHIAHGYQPISSNDSSTAALKCHCNKIFKDNRALNQHMNRCTSKEAKLDN